MGYRVLEVHKQADLSHGCSQCCSLAGSFLVHVVFYPENIPYFKWMCSSCILKGGDSECIIENTRI